MPPVGPYLYTTGSTVPALGRWMQCSSVAGGVRNHVLCALVLYWPHDRGAPREILLNRAHRRAGFINIRHPASAWSSRAHYRKLVPLALFIAFGLTSMGFGCLRSMSPTRRTVETRSPDFCLGGYYVIPVPRASRRTRD